MKAVIMAGGFGTRLKPLTINLPKPMVPMVNRPMMEHIVLLLKQHGITDLVCLLFYQPEKITSYFGNGGRFGVNITYVRAEEDYGTAGSVRNAGEYLTERFLVISADVLTDLDLTKAIEFHQARKAKATVVLTRVKNPLAYGVVITDPQGKISRFLEKPSWGQVFSDTVNTGIYILEPEVLRLIPPKTEFDFSKNLFPILMAHGEPLYGYIAEGYWRDIGDLNEYQKAHLDCLNGRVKVSFPGKPSGNTWLGEGGHLGKGVQFEGVVVLGDDCTIEDRVSLSNTVVGNHCRIGEGAKLRHAILWDHVTVGEYAQLVEDVVASNCEIGPEAFLQENVFVSENCRIGPASQIYANVKIWPEKTIEAGAVLNSSLIWGDRWLRELFSDARVSGLANTEVSPEFGAKLGAAFGAFLGEGSYVVTSRDPSEAARMINRALICGFMSAGVHVQDLRAMPIPIVRYELRSGAEKGGIHVRRSPLDAHVVDIIFLDADGRDLPVGKAKAVERLFLREDFARASYDRVGRIDFPVRVTESYVEDFLKHLDVRTIERARFKVVIDYSFGGAATTLPSILGSLNGEVISLNAYLDTKRLTRNLEEWNRAIHQLSTIVKSIGADVGFLLDPGAEKLFVIDEKGRFIDSDRLTVLVTKMYLQTQRPKRIAVPITASSMVDHLAQEHGVKIFHTRNDHRSMIDAVFTHNVQYVGGTKGGFIFTDFHFACDGMFAMAKLLELMAKSGQHFGELYDSIPWTTMVRDQVPCSWEMKGKVMRRLMEFSEGLKREVVDGVRIYDDDSWVLVIPDREQAFFHVIAESPLERKARKLLEGLREKIIQWRDAGE